jgi:hypothetical protein
MELFHPPAAHIWTSHRAPEQIAAATICNLLILGVDRIFRPWATSRFSKSDFDRQAPRQGFRTFNLPKWNGGRTGILLRACRKARGESYDPLPTVSRRRLTPGLGHRAPGPRRARRASRLYDHLRPADLRLARQVVGVVHEHSQRTREVITHDAMHLDWQCIRTQTVLRIPDWQDRLSQRIGLRVETSARRDLRRLFHA